MFHSSTASLPDWVLQLAALLFESHGPYIVYGCWDSYFYVCSTLLKWGSEVNSPCIVDLCCVSKPIANTLNVSHLSFHSSRSVQLTVCFSVCFFVQLTGIDHVSVVCFSFSGQLTIIDHVYACYSFSVQLKIVSCVLVCCVFQFFSAQLTIIDKCLSCVSVFLYSLQSLMKHLSCVSFLLLFLLYNV